VNPRRRRDASPALYDHGTMLPSLLVGLRAAAGPPAVPAQPLTLTATAFGAPILTDIHASQLRLETIRLRSAKEAP
jgi:hypothetical protein